MTCDKTILASILALHYIRVRSLKAEHLADQNSPSRIHDAAKNVERVLRHYFQHNVRRIIPKQRDNTDSPSAMSEKKAPNQSIVRNPKSIPTTRPLLFQSSNGTGKYPMIKSTAATTPTSVTGHDNPRRYGARMTRVKSTSMPAKKSARTVARSVVVQIRHFLILIQDISQSEQQKTFSNTPAHSHQHSPRPPNPPPFPPLMARRINPKTHSANSLSPRSPLSRKLRKKGKKGEHPSISSPGKNSPPIPQTLRPTRQT